MKKHEVSPENQIPSESLNTFLNRLLRVPKGELDAEIKKDARRRKRRKKKTRRQKG